MMQRRLLLSAAVAAPVVLSGCASQSIDGYASEKPVLTWRSISTARSTPGHLQDRSGQIVSVSPWSWTARGRHEGVLDEAFTYSDGTTQRRICAYKTRDGRYTVFDDVVARPTADTAMPFAGTTTGAARDGTLQLDLDDWMYSSTTA